MSDLGLCPRDWSTRYCTYRRERPSLHDLLSEFGLISDGWLGSISPLEIGPMHLSVEGLRPWDWSYPVLQYLREWPTPTVIIFDMALSLNPNIHPTCLIGIAREDNEIVVGLYTAGNTWLLSSRIPPAPLPCEEVLASFSPKSYCSPHRPCVRKRYEIEITCQ